MTVEKLLYHITDLDNLESIFQRGGLLAHNMIVEKSVEYENIAHSNIQSRRLKKKILLPPYGILHDYIPFYFAPRSPMLYAILKGQVEGYEKGQSNIIYLVSRVDIIHNAGLKYVFTDGHAIMNYSEFYNDLDDLGKIDWDLMKATYWNSTPDDPNRSTRRQAEFLVNSFVPSELFLGIAVKNEEMKQKVVKVANKYNFNKLVAKKDSWYY